MEEHPGNTCLDNQNIDADWNTLSVCSTATEIQERERETLFTKMSSATSSYLKDGTALCSSAVSDTGQMTEQ